MKIINNGKIKLNNPERIYTLGNVSIIQNHIVDVENYNTGFYAEYDETQDNPEIFVQRVQKREVDDLLPQITTTLWDKSTNWEHIVEILDAGI